MSIGRTLLAMLKADFLERTRRSSFLITLCLVIYLGYAVNTGQISINLEGYRGVYNSAWVGSLMAVVITFFLGIAGFYLVKNTIDRDERTGVGQILATTPITNAQYLLGKWLSNFSVLTTLVGILAVAAIIMQAIQQEVTQIQLGALIAPFLFIALPMMAMVAAFAVFFESIPLLKGGFGNLIYFWVFISIFVASIFLSNASWLDVTGISLMSSSMKVDILAVHPGYLGGFVLTTASSEPIQTFVWSGINWSMNLIFQRIGWFFVAVSLVLIGSFFFNRFNPNQRSILKARQNASDDPGLQNSNPTQPQDAKTVQLTPLPQPNRFHFNYLRLIWLESLLLIKGMKWYWFAGMAVLFFGSIAESSETMRRFWYLGAVIWPVLVWSKMGQREVHCQTEQLVYQAAYPILRLSLSSWLAGIIITGLTTSGVLIGRIIAAEPVDLLSWILSVLFIPTLAITLGTWSRSSKLFEVVYPIIWYLGPFNQENGLAILDYLGFHSQSPVSVAPLYFTGFLFLLMLLTIVGRRQQMQM